MSSKFNFNRWARSKQGRMTLLGVLGILLILAVVIGLVIAPGTAYVPPSYPPPDGGYTCLPGPCKETEDGKFFSMPGEQMASFGGESTIAWVSVPGDYEAFELNIFDGDSGRDENGNIGKYAGNWDSTTTQVTYKLYADPMKDGPPKEGEGEETQLGTWYGNDSNPTSGTYCTTSSDIMPNNDWYTITCDNVDEARGPEGHYFYRLEATRPATGGGISAFKLRSNAYLSTGQSNMADANFAIVGMVGSYADYFILYPEFQGDWNNPGPSIYNGAWDFYFEVSTEYPTKTVSLEIWDGDFDRGTSATTADDKDDLNTEGKPEWAKDNRFVVDERAGGQGAPPDDQSFRVLRVAPAVWYEITDPTGQPIYTNNEPSGTEEWERYVISTDPGIADPDATVTEIKPGWYGFHIEGLDLHNTVWIRANYEFVTQPPPPRCDATCPRTIGYWKNNVKKVLIQGRTKGVQESPESIRTALHLIAQYSPLYRAGINVKNPKPIDTIARLSDEEAHMILQRDKNDYPGGRKAANSMLARALQQNLATWLNVMSGKICPDTVVTLDAHGGPFDGTVWDALQEAQDIILNGGDLERAKDIGDLINNGALGEDAPANKTCNEADYQEQIPPDKQPPKHEDKPKAPKREELPNPTPEPQPDPETCEGVRVNQYKVEVTNNPFAGVKFEFVSGTEIKNSDFDEFKVTVPTGVAEGLTSVQLEAKASTDVEIVTLEAEFDQPLPSGETIMGDNAFFAFYFMGAVDNGDGTMTLTFQVQNFTEHALSHVTIGLPDGVVSDPYESRVCP